MIDQSTLAPEQRPVRSTSRTREDVSAVRRSPESVFHRAIDELLVRPLGDVELREGLLLAALQHAGFIGAAWYSADEGRLKVRAELLEHQAFQHPVVRQTINDQASVAAQQQRELFIPHQDAGDLVQLSVPFELSDGRSEVIALISSAESSLPQAGVHVARSLVRALLLHRIQQDLQSRELQLRTTAALLELAERIESVETLSEAQRVLADTVREHLHCKFVAVGWKRPVRITCQVSAVAGLAEFDPRSNRTRRLKAALDEALVRGIFTSWPATSEDGGHQTMAHQKLAEDNHVPAVASLPLRCSDGEVVGALVAGGEENLLTPDAVGFLQTLDLPVGTALRAVRRAQGGPLRQLGRLLRKGHSAILACILFTALIAGVLLIPFPYRVGCAFRCEPVQSHFTVAPYDGVLESIYVEPGDSVTAGQLLATMDAREIRWELASLTADSQRAGKERDVHLADERIADAIIAGLEVERLQGRRDLLIGRLAQLEIRSTVDGIVLAGNLGEKENYPVEEGQTLYEIASVDAVRMEVAIPDIEIDHIRVGLPVQFRPDSDPTRVVQGTIERIRPRSETVGDRNVFVAEATIDNPAGRLRPGMEGVARIQCEAHPLGWNLFHKAWEYTLSRVLW